MRQQSIRHKILSLILGLLILVVGTMDPTASDFARALAQDKDLDIITGGSSVCRIKEHCRWLSVPDYGPMWLPKPLKNPFVPDSNRAYSQPPPKPPKPPPNVPATNDTIQALLQDKANYVTNNDAGPYWWPNQQDIDLSKKYDALYGSPQAPNATPGAAYMRTAPLAAAVEWRNLKYPGNAPEGTISTLNTEADADRIRAENLAAERSAVAKLGWDPGLFISTPPGPERFNIAGGAKPLMDVYWYDQNSPAASMHESMHRGIEMLRQKGLVNVPKGLVEEAHVRALMQRAYGDVETKHYLRPGGVFRRILLPISKIEIAKGMANDPIIDNLEKVAAEEVARRHPRGPR